MGEVTYDFTLDFKEFKRDAPPWVTGIYCVYVGTYDGDAKKWSVRKRLYIGQSDNVHKRFSPKHDYEETWNRCCNEGEKLLFTVAEHPFSPDVRINVERKLIFMTGAKCNYVRPYENPDYRALWWNKTPIHFLVKGDWYSMGGYLQLRPKGIKCEEEYIRLVGKSTDYNILKKL